MVDFEVQRCTRHCAKTEREFRPGETFVSVLIEEGKDVVRYDYALDAWEGPPENVVGWWKAQMPEPNAKKVNWAPNDVMLHYFESLEADATKADVRYVLALLMVRRRILRLEETETADDGSEVLVLYCAKKEAEYKVTVLDPTGERVAEIQDELSKLLYSDAA